MGAAAAQAVPRTLLRARAVLADEIDEAGAAIDSQVLRSSIVTDLGGTRVGRKETLAIEMITSGVSQVGVNEGTQSSPVEAAMAFRD